MTNKVTYSFVMLDKFSRAAKKIKQSVNGIKASLTKSMPAMKRYASRMKKVSGSMKKVGQNLLLKVTLPIVAMGAKMLKTSADFELSMNNVKALSKATGKGFIKLRNLALDLGSKTKFMARDAAEGMGVLARAGQKTNKILGSTPAVLDLATAAKLSMAEAAGIVTGVMAGYKLDIKDLTKVNDLLVQAFTNSKTDLIGLGEAFKFGGSIASSMGMSLKESTTILATFGKRNIEASMAGTALRGIISKLINPSKEAVKIFRNLKIKKRDILESKNKIRSLIKIIELFEKKGLTAANAMQIFQERGGPAVIGLMEEGSSSMKKFMKILDKAGGRTKEIANVQMKGLTGSVRSLSSAFEGLEIAIGDAGLLEFATQGAMKLTSFTRSLKKMDTGTLKLIATIAGIAAAIAPATIALAIILNPIGQIVTAVGLLAAGISALIIKWESWQKSLSKTVVAPAFMYLMNAFGILGDKKTLYSGVSAGANSILGKTSETQAPVKSTNDTFNGVLDINVKDKAKNIQSMQIQKSGFLDVGLSRVGI